MKHPILLLILSSVVLFSCVTKKKYQEALDRYEGLNANFAQSQKELKQCLEDKNYFNTQKSNLETESKAKDDKNAELAKQIDYLKNQVEYLKETNSEANKRIQEANKQIQNIATVSTSQAESIKKSFDNLQAKDAYIQNLQTNIAQRDSVAMNLLYNLKSVIGNLDDKDINIKIDKDVVYIDISDKMLFKSGSYEITPRASVVLGKVAKIVNNQPDIEFMVEGHTDNVPYRKGDLLDNWDLSVKRATAVVRELQANYGVAPARMTAAGRGEYVPIADNDTAEGKSTNRRTRIIITPEYGQFYELLKAPTK